MTPLDCGFCPARARGKRPVPMWADSFLRDTLHLEADEVGAYHLILYAMWKRTDCSLPLDHKRLAKIARVTTYRWNSRIGPAVLEFFTISDGSISSKKLTGEARFVEKHVTKQHKAKCEECKNIAIPDDKISSLGIEKNNEENSPNPLKTHKPPLTVVTSMDTTTDKPTQQHNNPTIKTHDDDAGARDLKNLRFEFLKAIGVDPVTGRVGSDGVTLGRMSDLMLIQRWSDDLGLSLGEQLQTVREVMNRKRDGPPNSFEYFTPAMRVVSAAKHRPRLEPAQQEEQRIDNIHRMDAAGRRSNAGHDQATAALSAAFQRAISEGSDGNSGGEEDPS